jgi:hypothetical protein
LEEKKERKKKKTNKRRDRLTMGCFDNIDNEPLNKYNKNKNKNKTYRYVLLPMD